MSAARRDGRKNQRRQRRGRPPAASPPPRRDWLPGLQPAPFDKWDWLAAAAAVAGPLLLYVLSLSSDVLLEDDGLFLMAGTHLGIAHPPGYPLYTLILHLFLQLPFGTPALMGHSSSAVFGALACGALYGCARLAGVSRVAALAAAWLFGAQEHVWSQAIIAEVYSLNLLLLFSMYGLLCMAARNPERRGVWMAAAVCYGFGIANHWPLVVLATPGLALLILPVWKTALRQWSAAAAGAACVALPYLWMVWRSQQDLVISFHDPIESLSSFWRYFSRADYAGVDASPSAGWPDRLSFLQWFGAETALSLTPAGFLLAALGLWVLLRRRRLEAWAGMAIWASQSLVLLVLLNFDFEYLQVGVFRPYSLVCYGLVALWAAVGLHVLTQLLQRRLPLLARPAAAAAMQGAAGLILAAIVVLGNWPVNNRSAPRFTQAFTDLIFDQLPDDALFLVFEDIDTGLFGYQHFVEGKRPDVLLLNTQGLVFTNRLFGSRERSARKTELLTEYVANTERRVFALPGGGHEWCPGCSIRHSGFLVELRPDGLENLQITRSPGNDQYFRELLETQTPDAWEYATRGSQMRSWGQYLGRALLYGNADLIDQVTPLIELAEQDFHCLMGIMGEVLERWDGRHLERAQEWIAHMRQLHDHIRLAKYEQAEFLTMEGTVRFNAGDRDGAIALFLQSLEVYNHPDNTAHNSLRQLGIPVN